MSLQLSCITKQSHVNIHRLIQLDIIYTSTCVSDKLVWFLFSLMF